MKYRLISLFAGLAVVLVLSGCSGASASSSGSTPQPGKATASVPSPAASSTPESTTIASGSPTVMPGASVPANWKEFTSKGFQVKLSYPANWTVKETQSGVDLSSPQGVMILLAQVATGGLSAEQFLNQNQLPNTRCTPSSNPHGLQVITCFDTIARSYSGYVVVRTPQGNTELLSLDLNQTSEVQNFETIIASLQVIGS